MEDGRKHAIDLMVDMLKQLNTFALAGMAGVVTLATLSVDRTETVAVPDVTGFVFAGISFLITCIVNQDGQRLAVRCALDPSRDLRPLDRRILIADFLMGAGIGAATMQMLN